VADATTTTFRELDISRIRAQWSLGTVSGDPSGQAFTADLRYPFLSHMFHPIVVSWSILRLRSSDSVEESSCGGKSFFSSSNLFEIPFPDMLEQIILRIQCGKLYALHPLSCYI
jgi:hypothetical protein